MAVMFERYNEPARRALFFARYEASVLGALSVDPEHLLLGLLRQRDPVLAHLLDRMSVAAEEIRLMIHSRIGPSQAQIDTSVEMPFSDDTKDVLKYTAQEAERLLHPYIGCEHLLLGLLRYERGLAWDVLREKGLNISPVREALVMHLSATLPLPPEIAGMVASMEDAMRSRVEGVKRVQRSGATYLMTVVEGAAPGRRATYEEPGSGGGMSLSHVGFTTREDRPPGQHLHSIGPITMSGATLPQFALMLEEFLGGSVMVEDGALFETFDIELEGEYTNADALIAALRDQLGLVLTKSV
jgi:hypothetical protein